MARLCLIGDVHGYLDRLTAHLQQAKLIDGRQNWCGGDATLVCLGDLVDRGPDGIGVIELLMRLQAQGDVRVLLGNHDVGFLGAHRVGEPIASEWAHGGGLVEDLARLTEGQAEWVATLPALALVREHLLMHADAMLYLDYGRTIDEVNTTIGAILRSDDAQAWLTLLERFDEHFAFSNAGAAEAMVATFGGRTIVHGHTPIVRVTGQSPESVTEALVYADGLCVNVDPGMYRGGPGFVYEALVD